MPNPAIWLADEPKEMLQILHKAAKDVASEEFRELFANEKHLEVYVRITDLPISDSLRDIRQATASTHPSYSCSLCSCLAQICRNHKSSQ